MSPGVTGVKEELEEKGDSIFDSAFVMTFAELSEVSLTSNPANPEAGFEGGPQIDEVGFRTDNMTALYQNRQRLFEAHTRKEADMPEQTEAQILEGPSSSGREGGDPQYWGRPHCQRA